MVTVLVSLPVIYGIISALGHFFSEKVNHFFFTYKTELVSFSAGISTTYIFLELLPDVYKQAVAANQLFLPAFILAGFVAFHLFEKYLYQHTAKRNLSRDLSRLHSVSFFVYHFLLGILLFILTSNNFVSGTLFFGVILMHTVLSSASLERVHGKVTQRVEVKALLSVSTLLGVLVAQIFPITELFFFMILSLASGIILYVVIRESLPTGPEGKPGYFFVGAAIYATIIISTLGVA